jgi:hypothetical protein
MINIRYKNAVGPGPLLAGAWGKLLHLPPPPSGVALHFCCKFSKHPQNTFCLENALSFNVSLSLFSYVVWDCDVFHCVLMKPLTRCAQSTSFVVVVATGCFVKRHHRPLLWCRRTKTVIIVYTRGRTCSVLQTFCCGNRTTSKNSLKLILNCKRNVYFCTKYSVSVIHE